ncbi:MAG: hypothetical protein ACR2OC_11225 [Solirubrobacterales bacterium]
MRAVTNGAVVIYDLKHWKRSASANRCQLRWLYEQAIEHLDPVDLSRLASHLESITPITIIDKAGHRRRAEDRFKLRPKDRRDLAAALLLHGVAERKVPSLVSLSRSTWWRIRADYRAGTLETTLIRRCSKRSDVSFRDGAGGRPTQRTYSFDATSGADLTFEAQRALRSVLGMQS